MEAPSGPVSTEAGSAHPIPSPARVIRFGEALGYWLKLGFINFGGPAGQIALMHNELVVRRRWISNERFLHALNFCMLLPGPEAQQLAIYIGWLLHRTPGGLVAGIFFVLPAYFVMLGLSWAYAVHGNLPSVAAIFHGLRAAVIAIVALAVLQIGSKALRHPLQITIAVAAFLAIFFLKVPFPAIILAAALAGLTGGWLWPRAFQRQAAGTAGMEAEVIGDHVPPPEHSRPEFWRTVRVLAIGLLAWWGPLAVLAWCQGRQSVLTQEAIFFSKAAMLTFGGAYAVLAYIAQAAVDQYGWLRAEEMLDGLGLAESTPGPLIMVTQFVGFLGAYRNPGGMDPSIAGILGATVTTWATFAPCFLWIFLGAPFIEQLRGNRALNATLSAITAAVVGVVLNLAVWFGLHTLFRADEEKTLTGVVLMIPRISTLDVFALLVASVCFVGMWRFRWRLVPVVLGSALGGFVYYMIFA